MESAGRDSGPGPVLPCATRADTAPATSEQPQGAATPQEKISRQEHRWENRRCQAPRCPYPCCTWLWYTLFSSESRRPSVGTSRGRAVSGAQGTRNPPPSGDRGHAGPSEGARSAGSGPGECASKGPVCVTLRVRSCPPCPARCVPVPPAERGAGIQRCKGTAKETPLGVALNVPETQRGQASGFHSTLCQEAAEHGVPGRSPPEQPHSTPVLLPLY